MWPQYGELFAEWEERIITRMVRAFEEENSWMRFPEREDLLEECFIHWWSVRDQFTSERGASIETYMRSVVKKFLADVRKKEWAMSRRGSHFNRSLDEPAPDSKLPLRDTIPDVKGIEEVERRLDIERAIDKLSPSRQRIWRLKASGYSLREIERKVGVPKSTIHEELREIISIFADEGLAEYLQ